MKEQCPDCGCFMVKVIYMGFPMRLCNRCSRLAGFWSFLLDDVLPFNGYFFVYEKSYLKALWHWLFNQENNE